MITTDTWKAICETEHLTAPVYFPYWADKYYIRFKKYPYRTASLAKRWIQKNTNTDRLLDVARIYLSHSLLTMREITTCREQMKRRV